MTFEVPSGMRASVSPDEAPFVRLPTWPALVPCRPVPDGWPGGSGDRVVGVGGPQRLIGEQTDVGGEVQLAVRGRDVRIGRRQVGRHDRVVDIVLVDVVHFDVGEQVEPHRAVVARAGVAAAGPGRVRKLAEHAVVVVDCDAALTQVVVRLDLSGPYAHLLHCGDEQRHQDRDDRDHDEQLDEGEA